MNIKFLNIDLDIQSTQDIYSMLNELGANILILNYEKQDNYYFASLEIDRDISNAEKIINYFCDLIESLSKDSRDVWDSCVSKVFDLGYESGTQPYYFTSNIQPLTIKRIANLGASLNITIYPVSESK